MKKIALVAALALTSIMAAPVMAQSATTPNAFNVVVNFTSACLVNTAAAALNFGTYTAFGTAGNAAPTTSISFKCTRGLTISSVAFDSGSGAGVIAGLNYGMTVSPVARVLGTAATPTVAGTSELLTYLVTGSMIDGQAGQGASSAAATSTVGRTLIITY